MVTPQIGDAFGQERALGLTCRLLKDAGHEVFLVADRKAGALPPNDGALLVPGLSSQHTLTSPSVIRQSNQAVLHFVASKKTQIVHLHDCFDFRLLHSLGKSYATLLTAHTISATCPSGARLTSNSTPCSHTSGWGCIPHHYSQKCLDFLKTDLHRAHAIHSYLLRRRALRAHLRFVLAPSEYVESTFIADGWAPDQIRRVPNPLVWPESPRKIEGAPSPLFVFAGRITPLKGLETLLQALAALKDRQWRLWVCGEGSESETMKALTAELGLSRRVRFWGRTDPDLTQRILATASAVIAPNRGPETFGLTVAEACAMGTPVVTARIPALDEWIHQGVTGQVFPPGDAFELAQRLEFVLDHPEIVNAWAVTAQRWARSLFSQDAHLESTLAAYSAALGLESVSESRNFSTRRVPSH